MMDIFVSRLIGFLFGASVLLVAVSGCGGSDGPPPNANPNGYYDVNGTANVDDGMGGTLQIDDLQALVHGNRIMMMSVNHGLLYDGTITSISQNTFTADFTVYTDGQTPVSASASGTITQGSTVTGTLTDSTGTGVGNGTFRLTYATTNNQVAALSRVENTAAHMTWGAIVGNSNIAFEVKIDGVGSVVDDVNNVGGLFQACEIFNGTISPIAGTNLYQVNGDLDTCSDVNVRLSYSGLATTRSDSNPDNVLVFMMTSGSYGFYGDFQ